MAELFFQITVFLIHHRLRTLTTGHMANVQRRRERFPRFRWPRCGISARCYAFRVFEIMLSNFLVEIQTKKAQMDKVCWATWQYLCPRKMNLCRDCISVLGDNYKVSIWFKQTFCIMLMSAQNGKSTWTLRPIHIGMCFFWIQQAVLY